MTIIDPVVSLPPSRPLRIAVVGAGLMGRWHGEYARRLGARVVAVVDRSHGAASRLAGRLGDATAFEAMDSMLTGARPDVVHICTPLSTHIELAGRAIEAGAHALVEKPLASTAHETGALIEAASERGVLLCPVHQFAFQRAVAHAAAHLPSLGYPVQASFSICSAGGETERYGAPDEIIADMLPHPFSVLQALWPGCDLQFEQWSVQAAREGELHARGACGDLGVSVWISMNARPSRCELDVACTRGSLSVNFFHGYCVVRRGKPSRLEKVSQPFRVAGRTFLVAGANLIARALRRETAYPGLLALMGAFYAAVRGQAPNPIPEDDALAVARIREHLLRERERARLSS